MKEVFHHKQMIKIMPDPNNYGSYVDSVFYIKSGPYTRYYENGNLQCSGFYKDEKKDSTWKYYDSKGDFIKEEHYNKGVLVK
jgi:antitoxin component YwqK of YwqJK toxin-antitoxin module